MSSHFLKIKVIFCHGAAFYRKIISFAYICSHEDFVIFDRIILTFEYIYVTIYIIIVYQEVALNKSEKIRFGYGIFLAVFTVIVGVVFIAQVAELYYSGIKDGLSVIYTTERISSRLILPLIFLGVWIAAIIAGFVLSVVFPIKEKRAVVRDDGKTLALLRSKMPERGDNAEYDAACKKIKQIEKARICVWCIVSAILLIYGVYIMIFVFNPANFHSDRLREDVLVLVRHLIALVIVGFAVAIVAVIFEGVAARCETEFVKKAIVSGDRSSVPTKQGPEKHASIVVKIICAEIAFFAVELFMLAPFFITWILGSGDVTSGYIAIVAIFFVILIVSGYLLYKTAKKYVPESSAKVIKLYARIAVGGLAIVFIVAGALNGGAGAVLTKAINICTECIGLG